MIRKLLTSVAVAGLVAGAANALGVENNMPGVEADEQYPLADALSFDDDDTNGDIIVSFAPDSAALPDSQLLLFVDVTGGVFSGALSGAEVGGSVDSAVVSVGGGAGATSVTYIISGADDCNADDNVDGAPDSDCTITLPMDLNGSDVTVSVGIETTDNNPVDNSSSTNQTTITVVDIQPAFDVDIVADTDVADSTAILAATTGPFEAFTGDVLTSVQGTLDFQANAIAYLTGAAAGTPIVVNTDLTGTDVAPGDVDEVNVTFEGIMDAFTAATAVNADNTVINDDFVTDEDDDDAVLDMAAFFGQAAPAEVTFTADGTTAIARSEYAVTVEITPAGGSDLTAGTVATGSLQPITRDGTTIVFPWTQSASQGAASGTTSVFRIGNLDNSAAGAVFVEVKNASEAGFMNAGITELAASIDANGEFVTNSTTLEGAVGNYGRGDLEFTVEAEPTTLTGRQFVVKDGVIQQVTGGTIEQDLN
ncbi:MAG: hypothetical protein Hens2KO_22030 [Henriciella sp.]